jgi:hypothetical protein
MARVLCRQRAAFRLIQFSVADKKAVKSCVTPFPEHGKSKCLLASGEELVPPGALSTIISCQFFGIERGLKRLHASETVLPASVRCTFLPIGLLGRDT